MKKLIVVLVAVASAVLGGAVSAVAVQAMRPAYIASVRGDSTEGFVVRWSSGPADRYPAKSRALKDCARTTSVPLRAIPASMDVFATSGVRCRASVRQTTYWLNQMRRALRQATS